MAEYISREDILDIASQYCPDDDESCSRADVDLREMLDEIEALPSADVQPVKCGEWIRIKDKLPENDVEVMLYDTDCGIVLGWYDDEMEDFAAEFISPLDSATHWMPLPEPPKEG